MKNAKYILLVAVVSMLGVGCKGPKGDTGASGGGRVISTIYCQGAVSGTAYSQLNGLNVEYNAVLTSGGDVYATANIVDESTQASGTQFYAAGESGSSTAAVAITNDYVGVANGGFWEISLNRNTLVTSVVYDDPSIASPIYMNFTASACQVGNF